MPRLILMENGNRRVFDVGQGPVTIGRSTKNVLSVMDLKASRLHCRLEESGGAWRIVDEGSQNGTLVNGSLITARSLRTGDVIEIGATRIVFEDAAGKAPPAGSPAKEKPIPEELGRTMEIPRGAADQPGDGVEDLLRDRANLLRLQRVARAINSELEIEHLLEIITDHAVELTDAERGFLILFAEDGEEMQFACSRSFAKEAVDSPEYTISRSIARRVLDDETAVVAVNAVEDERFRDIQSISVLGLRSVLCLPFRMRDRVRGVLYIDNRLQKGVFNRQDLRMLEALADQAAAAIERARLFKSLQEKGAELAESNLRIESLNRRLQAVVNSQASELEEVRETLRVRERELATKYNYRSIIGTSTAMRDVLRLLDRVIESEMPVLILGESGTGKELIARAVHYNGPRRRERFVTENCGALTDTLLESELFGYVRGAFTGADRNKKGLFEQAHRGTLFLDEVGETSPDMQKKLLRALQEGEIRPVGGKEVIPVDVRIISASNRDPLRMCREGLFREDLYYRLNVLQIVLPPLRDRREDIPLLLSHFLEKHSARVGRPVPRVERPVMALLEAYDWPGNVRELENEAQKMVALSEGIVTTEVLSEAIRTGPSPPPAVEEGVRNLDALVERVERDEIARALRMAGGNKTRAAGHLGISRFTLQRKLDKYGMNPGDPGDGEGEGEAE
ncbi:MAG: sigma 54-interacting transcriptional regulator [Planctomycetaceae bacterium]|nr:sigma 54-interacting transcriptional regulator [Planctomycetota bacterium]NUN52244.1 sigma 54-interacting transcriptional regulator [Planctomycetaceae bacterium]